MFLSGDSCLTVLYTMCVYVLYHHRWLFGTTCTEELIGSNDPRGG